MTKKTNAFCKAGLVLAGLLTLVTTTEAFPFISFQSDLALGFRKTGIYAGNNECVVNLGNAVTNFVNLALGTTINITAYSPSQLVPDSFANLTNLSWSVCGYNGAQANPPSSPGYPRNTIWVTVPRANLGVPSTPPDRLTSISQQTAGSSISSIFSGANLISPLIASNQDNTMSFLKEPINQPNITQGQNYGVWMGGINDPNTGTLQDTWLQNNLENTTRAPFTTAVQLDLYEVRPTGVTDPHTGLTSGAAYYVGYFQLNPNGSMTFTREAAGSVTLPPVAGFTGAPRTGFAPLSTVFSNTSTGSFTNSVWTFGDGQTVTNITGNVTNSYAAAGSYTVTLKVTGAGGASTNVQTSYIVASPKPTIAGVTTLANGNLVLGGTNCPAGVQYRILTSTNLVSWTPVVTNVFLPNGTYAYTNATTNAMGFFQLVSP